MGYHRSQEWLDFGEGEDFGERERGLEFWNSHIGSVTPSAGQIDKA
jgi:hypothetical protein